MKRIAPFALWLLMVIVGSFHCFSEVSTNALVYQVKLAKEVFALGEPINLTRVWSNRSAEILHAEHPGHQTVHVFFEGKEELEYQGAESYGPLSYFAIRPRKAVTITY